jgi:16S rRNA (cytosine967-C5)-methyltransferase
VSEDSPDRRRPRQPDARRLAFEVLTRVETTDAYANVLLDARLRSNRLDRPDRALVTELVYGVLRWQGRLDWVLAPLLDRPVAALDPAVRRLLRLGAYQLVCLDRIPAFAAVDATVSLAHEIGAGRAAGYVNAVLRRLARGPIRQAPDPAADPVGYWTGPGSHPAWVVDRWLHRLGPEEAGALMAANNRVPPLTVLANRLRGTLEDAEQAVRRAAPGSVPGRFVLGSFTLRGVGSPRDLPGFPEGRFLPMDEAGALPVLALDLAAGHRVLDACAGGGGKTALIAGAIGPTGEVLALDRNPRAIRRLSEAVARLGLASVRVKLYDARDAGGCWTNAFPRVLVDAPCSGLGTLRRRPEIKWRRRPEDLRQAAALQTALLDGAAGAVAPGGLLVYSTCSLEPEETDEVIDAFLHRHQAFAPEDPGPALRAFADPGAEGRLRAWPHRHETDGFFIARLRRGS